MRSQLDWQYFAECGDKIIIWKKSLGNYISCYVDIRCELLDQKILRTKTRQIFNDPSNII